MDFRAKDQTLQKLRETAYVRGWKSLVKLRTHQGLLY